MPDPDPETQRGTFEIEMRRLPTSSIESAVIAP
jgi:hypothetical protein